MFSAIGGSSFVSFVMTGRSEPIRFTGMSTTASLADVLRVQPVRGRWYTEQEDRLGGPKVVVLTHGFWKRQLGADPAVLGRAVMFDGQPYTVIGIMPERFSYRTADVLVPLQLTLDPADRGQHFLSVYARLQDGVTLERATVEMRALGRTLAREFGHNHGIDVSSYHEALVGDIRTPLYVLLGAVFLVLRTACANVANLLLAAGVARRRELAIRLALGAAPKDLVRQLAVESVMLAVAGGALGVLLSVWILKTFVVLAGNQLPRASAVGVDARVFTFAAVVSLTVGVICGVWPMLRMRTRELAAAVREGGTRAGTGADKRFGNGLVVAEIAIAFALLVGAGLLIKNLVLLNQRDAGVRTAKIVAFNVAPAGPRYKSDAQTFAFFRDLYHRLSRVGGVESVGMTSHLPMYNYGMNGEFSIEGGNPWSADEAPLVEYRWIFGEYLKTMGVPLVRGRLLDDRDRRGTRTVLINKAMAEKFWPGKDPIGRRFGQGKDVKEWYEVVGVIGNIRSYGLTREEPYEFYRTIEQSSVGSMTVVMRTRGEDPTSVVPAARQIVTSIDSAVPIADVQTMEHVVAESLGTTPAGLGVHGVVRCARGTARDGRGVRRDGVHRAASAARVRDSTRPRCGSQDRVEARRGTFGGAVVVRAALGAVGAWLMTGVLQTLLNDVEPTDPSVFAMTAAAVLGVTVVASILPARSAGRVNPMVVLREP